MRRDGRRPNAVPATPADTGPARKTVPARRVVFWGTYDLGKPRTRILRDSQLREAPKRVAILSLPPGEEMQHDTSPHRLMLGSHQMTAHCAGLHLVYSRMNFIQYYPHWTRFEARCFLTKAVAFM